MVTPRCSLLFARTAAIVACALSASAAEAQAAPTNGVAPAATKNDLAIVVSGGVSLGAYEGGYLYALGEELKRAGTRPVLYVGASAGTLNALLLAVEMCHAPVSDPALSPLRSAWMDASLAKLRQGTTTSPTAIFPQDGVRSIATQILTTWLTRGIDRDCDFVLVGETSRVHPRSVRVGGNETVPDIQEPFSIRVTVGQDGFPRIRNYVAEDGASPIRALLPFPRNQNDGTGRDAALKLLIDLALASSAFPAAFPQVDLPHCMTDPSRRGDMSGGETECGALRIERDTPFVDGGVLDNTPVGLAIETARGNWQAGARRWAPPRTPDAQKDRPEGLSYLLVDTNNDAYDTVPPPPAPLKSVLSLAGTFGSAFFDGARGRELYDTLQQVPELRYRLIVSELHPRLASRYLVDFFGFFDTRLRDFDFTAGMYDASQLVASGRLSAVLEGRPPPPPSSAPLAALPSPPGAALSWRKLACLAQAYGPRRDPGAYDACSPLPGATAAPKPWQPLDAPWLEPDFESFVQIAQASLDELYSQCLCAAVLSKRALGEACASLIHPNPNPPRLRAEFVLSDGWQRACSSGSATSPAFIEDDFAYAKRVLAQYGFAGASAAQTDAMVRARVGVLADDLVGRQPSSAELPATVLGPIAADAVFGYVPALHALHAVGGMGAAEAGTSYGRWLRAAAAVQLKASREGDFAVTPLAGIDWILPIKSVVAQARVFVRGGFQLGSVPSDDVSSPCWGHFGQAARCTVGQAGAAVTLLEVLRLQGVWEESPSPAGPWLDHLLVELGVQANWPIGR